jgi:glycosyltransferase involved in cell wall biosynthesis
LVVPASALQQPNGHIAIFLPSLAGGGAQRSMLSLAEGLAAAGIRVDLVVGSAIGRLHRQVPQGIDLIDLGAARVLGALPRLVAYLSRERPNVLISALDHANLVAICARMISRSPTRVFVSVRNTLSEKVQQSRSRRERMLPLLARRLYPLAEGVVAVSDGVRDDLVANIGLPPRLVQVLRNPVVTPQLTTLAQREPDHAWFRPGEPPVVLAAGRLTHQKDFATLLYAFDEVRRHHPCRLVILGEGPERADLESLVRRLGLVDQCDLHGFVDNPYAFMRRARLFVLSSAWEGLPGVLIQAMACGTPVLSTDCPSGPREILDDGRLGALVPVNDPKALAKAMLHALEKTHDRDALRARAQDYSLDRVVHDYLRYLGMGPAPRSN